MQEKDNFCSELKQLGADCTRCYEVPGDHWGICEIKGRPQALWGDVVHLLDRIMINHNHTRKGITTVETDMEISYKTKYPHGRYGADPAGFTEELMGKEKKLTQLLEGVKPEGATILRHHVHYNENARPDRVGLHIHLFYRAEDLADAKRMAVEILHSVKGDEIEQKL